MIIGLDVGGTHTDVVLLGTEGVIRQIKVATVADDLFHTVLTALEQITEGISPEEITRTVLSTTLTTNAIIRGQLEPVGMIVAGGPGIDPEVYRTNPHYYPVNGAVDHRGREVEALDQREIRAIAETLKKEGIRQIGVAGKFSVRNPNQELEIKRLLEGEFENIFLGHRTSGNLNFGRRIATTYLNAAVYPVHKKFYTAAEQSLQQHWKTLPIHILKADGGTTTLTSSVADPSQTILSGPAASIMGSISHAPAGEDCLVFDIGGTTTDMAILVDRTPLLNPLGITIGPYKTLIRSLETTSLGTGGDSLVQVDENGEIRIGPQRNGPAMAYGGGAPTPTDALFVLNEGGDGNREASEKGIRTLAESLGLTVTQTAERILEKTCRKILDHAEQMTASINAKPVYTVHELLEGHKIIPRRIIVLGGPASWFAGRLETISKLPVTVVPRWAVANAVGAALARTTCEVTLFADTQRQIVTAPEEDFAESVDYRFTKEEAVEKALSLLRAKALKKGADPEDLELEVLEAYQFNMVRGFHTTGRNIRVKVQVKPGIIRGYVPPAPP
jgi:N-methylhydantoinase A/oxoprolinase/acetone carboxylase beta subunit